MERRLLVVFALTFLIIMLFQPLLKKYGPQPPAKPASPPVAAQNQAQLPSQIPTPPPAQTSTEHGAAGTKAAAAPVQATSESETVIENDVYRIVFTNQGARVKSWVLKKYTDDKGGQLELVNRLASEKHGYPLTLWPYDAGLRDKVNSALYVAEPTAPTLPRSLRKGGRGGLGYIQRRVHLVPQPRVIRPQRQRIPMLLRSQAIHQLQLPALVVGIFLQHPGLHPRALIGEYDPVDVIFNHRLRLASGLHRCCRRLRTRGATLGCSLCRRGCGTLSR